MGSRPSKLASNTKLAKNKGSGGDEPKQEAAKEARSSPPAYSIQTPSALMRCRRLFRTHSALMRLPNELLLEITHYLPTTRDIDALLRANRRLALLFPHVLSAKLLHTYNNRTRHDLFSQTTVHAESLVARLISLNIDLDASVCNCTLPVSQWCRCAPPLHRAITNSNTAMVATLLRQGPSIMSRCDTTGDNAVHQWIQTAELCSGYFKIPREEDMAIMRLLLADGRLNRMNDVAAQPNERRCGSTE